MLPNYFGTKISIVKIDYLLSPLIQRTARKLNKWHLTLRLFDTKVDSSQ